MPTKFDRILDDCITQITLKGESVESCLAQYPDEAKDLEPLLRIIAQTGDAYTYTPSAQAKAQGRERLRAEMRSIEAKEAAKPSWNPTHIFSGMQRWAVASAAVLLLTVTSASTVAASQKTKPGDFLYPVKRTAENTRLALELSSESKANLEIKYAERRAGEIAKLLNEGDTDRVESAQKDLRSHLASAAKIAGNMDKEEAVAKVRTNLVTAGTESLAKLDVVVENASPQRNEVAVQTSKAAGGSFSDAIDSVPLPESIRAQAESKTSVVAPSSSGSAGRAADTFAGATGTIQIYVTDLPDNVEQFLVEITKVEVYLALGANSKWVDATTSPQIIDLSRISDVRKFLGEGQVQPGAYTRVRLSISSASAVLNGVQRDVKVPGSSIVINRPFKVRAGETTVLKLSFNGEKSLRSSLLGELLLVPSVHLSAKDPVASAGVAQQATTARESKPIEIEGTISAVVGRQIVVLGKPVTISNETKIEGRLVVGSKARIKANAFRDGTLIAIEIRVSAPDAIITPVTERPSSTLSPVEVPSAATPRPAEVKFSGIIDSLSPGVWVISGREVIISDRTRIDGTPMVGASTTIVAQIQSSGIIIASAVFIVSEIKPTETPSRPILEQRVTISGIQEVIDSTHWLIDSIRVSLTSETIVDGFAHSGSKAEVLGLKHLDGTVIALKARVAAPTVVPTRPTATPTPSSVQLTGVIQKLGERELLVANVHIILTNTTVITGGRLVIGSQVKIDGLLLKTGVISATSITVVSSPPVVPTATPKPATDHILPTIEPINPLAPTVK